MITAGCQQLNLCVNIYLRMNKVYMKNEMRNGEVWCCSQDPVSYVLITTTNEKGFFGYHIMYYHPKGTVYNSKLSDWTLITNSMCDVLSTDD